MLAYRGLMLDVSRGKVPTLATLLALVDGLAAHKYNQLQLYIEHTFDFPSHPDIGAGTDPLDRRGHPGARRVLPGAAR